MIRSIFLIIDALNSSRASFSLITGKFCHLIQFVKYYVNESDLMSLLWKRTTFEICCQILIFRKCRLLLIHTFLQCLYFTQQITQDSQKYALQLYFLSSRIFLLEQLQHLSFMSQEISFFIIILVSNLPNTSFSLLNL